MCRFVWHRIFGMLSLAAQAHPQVEAASVHETFNQRVNVLHVHRHINLRRLSIDRA